jgi:hypothetical protein
MREVAMAVVFLSYARGDREKAASREPWRTRAGVYSGFNSLTGRTSTLPSRAGGIFAAAWIASFKSRASIR